MDSSALIFAPPSGDQYEIGHGAHRATITEVGATLRAYDLDGVTVVDGFALDDIASGGHGQVLAPWPNRLADGLYTFDGLSERAPINEIDRSNAIHGLVRWLAWHPVSQTDDGVRLRCYLHPQPAYPWRLELQVDYRLGPDGLTVTTVATNLSAMRAPFGLGFHPYLTVGTPTVDPSCLLLPARQRLLTDENGLPVGETPVAGTPFDFTASRAIGSIRLDTAYTDLEREPDGQAVAVLSDPERGQSVTLWMDADFRYVMVYTGDTLRADQRRRAVALEPMTCPPNALRTGRDLIVLDPGGTWRGRWGLAPGPSTGEDSPRVEDAT